MWIQKVWCKTNLSHDTNDSVCISTLTFTISKSLMITKAIVTKPQVQFLLALLTSITLLSTSALAQDSTEDSVEYDFEEDVIDGSTKSPEELYIKGLGGSKINTLIKIRKDFQKEIVKSAEGI